MDPAPFIRGCVFPGTKSVPYPRADPSDTRIPRDTWQTAQLPVGVRLELVGVREGGHLSSEAFGDEDPSPALSGRRPVYFEEEGGFVETPVYDGGLIQPGQLVSGPAVIEEPDTTIVVYPGQEAMSDHYRTYVIEIR